MLLVEDAKTHIEVSKVDIADGKEIAGAKIQILDSEGNVFTEWTSTDEPHPIEKLVTGKTYTLHEEVSPYGYAIASDTTFVIDEHGNVTSSGTITEDGILLVEDTALDRPEFEKKIKDTNDTTGETSDWQDSADYDIGDSVPYKLTATLAKDVTEYWKYHVTFHDKMEESLTFEQIDSVKLNGTQLDAADYIFNKISDQEFSLTVEFGDGTGKITDTSLNGAKVDVYFSAKLNDKAALGKQGNVNTAKLEYSFNPNLVDDGEGGKKPSEDTEETEEDFVIAFTYQVDINKVDEEGKVLTGAEFKLEKKLPGDILKEIGSITAENGATFSFKGLDDGTYVLTETKAPAKYLSIDPIEFTVTAVHAAEWTDQAKRLEVLSELTGDVKDGVLTLNADDDLAKLTGDVADELTHIEVSKVG